MKKVGFLSGTFDPVHNGHILLCERVKEQYGLDEFWLVPERKSRSKRNVSPYEQRRAMLALATRNTQLKVVEVEEQTHSHAMLSELKNRGEVKLYMVVGADIAESINSWEGYNKINQLCTMVVAGRNNMTDSVDVEFSNSCSSKKIRQGECPECVPKAIEQYLIEHKIYAKE